MVTLDEAREEAGVPFVVISGFRSPAQNAATPTAAKDSAHLPDPRDGKARAVDGYFLGWSLHQQFIHLMQKASFRGIGAYPYPPPGRAAAAAWTPVVHVDRKDREHPRTVWIRNAAGLYVLWPSDEFWVELAAIARGVEVA